jgi:hypothetical protein
MTAETEVDRHRVSKRGTVNRFDSDKWQHGWRLAVGVIVFLAIRIVPVLVLLILLMWWSLAKGTRPPPARWHGIDRASVLCDSDGWLSDDRMTCVGGGRRWLCVRESRDYECSEAIR